MHFKLLLNFLLALLLVATAFCKGPQTETANDTTALAAPVTVYLLRHAEKDTSHPKEQDPELSAQGLARAETIKNLLTEVPVEALYVTRYKRSRQTLQPLAAERDLPFLVYEANDFKSMKERLLQQHQGQTVVVAAQANTLLPLIAELGAKIKISHIQESEYDYFFKVTISPDKTALVDVTRYTTDFPKSLAPVAVQQH